MLTATATSERAVAPRPQHAQVVVRRRRVVGVLASSAGGCALLAAAGLTALWWLAALFVLLASGYLALVARLRHLRVRRDMDLAFGADSHRVDKFDWRALERDLDLSFAPADAVEQTWAAPVQVDNRAIGRFLLCWALGWALTPVVALIRLVRGDQRPGLAGRIVRWQQYGRSQSLRLLTVGAAASVTLSAVGGLTATAGASPAAAAISTTARLGGTPGSYTVVAGDTLGAIARRSGTSVPALVAANHLADPNRIMPGEVLTLTGPVTTAPGAAGSYTVRAGDTMSAIARRFATTVDQLAQDNGIANPNLIFPGQVLTVPAGAPAPEPAVPAPAPTTVAAHAPAGHRYVVRPGDTLASLARRYSTTVAALASANGVANPNLIYPGQLLTVPTAAPAPAPMAATTAQAPAPVVAVAVHSPAPPAPAAAAAALTALPLPAQYLRGGSVDQGVDYSAPGGTPLFAMGPGKIIREGMDGFGPNTPVLQITAGPLAGKTVYYGHAGADLVPVGATVAAGQQISVVGSGIVGWSTGPHLEIGFYPPGGNGSGWAMLDYLNGAAGHPTGG